MTIVSAIAAMGQNRAIGKDNQLLWHLPADLKFFKETTAGHTVIMGRKTFDSVGKPLPRRRNIVITRKEGLEIEGCEVVHSVEEALALCAGEEEVFIVGGAEIYEMAMPQTDRIYLTIVEQSFEADAFFPEINPSIWHEIARREHAADEKHAFPFAFVTLERR